MFQDVPTMSMCSITLKRTQNLSTASLFKRIMNLMNFTTGMTILQKQSHTATYIFFIEEE